MAGGAAEVLLVSLNCPLPLRRIHPPTLVCCFCVFAAMGVTSTKSGRLEVNLSLSGKRGGKSHLGTILLSAALGIWRFCMVIRSLLPIFFLGGVTATAPSRDLTDNKKKEEGGLKQRRKQKEAAQGDPEPKKGNQEKGKNPSRVQS